MPDKAVPVASASLVRLVILLASGIWYGTWALPLRHTSSVWHSVWPLGFASPPCLHNRLPTGLCRMRLSRWFVCHHSPRITLDVSLCLCAYTDVGARLQYVVLEYVWLCVCVCLQEVRSATPYKQCLSAVSCIAVGKRSVVCQNTRKLANPS
jgi:hypothetical protein